MQIKQKNGTRLISLILLLGSSLFFYHTYNFPKEIGPVASEYGSAFFPRFLLIFIALMAVILIIQPSLKKNRAEPGPIVSLSGAQAARSLGLWLLCLGFYLSWLTMGYLYASPLFMLAAGLLMASRSVVLLAALAALGPLMYVVFEQLLKVGL